LIVITIRFIKLLQRSFIEIQPLQECFLLGIVIIGFYATPFISSAIHVRDWGIEFQRFSRVVQKVTWDRILIRRPRFGIPYDFSYIVLDNEERILVLRNAHGYSELIRLIQSKSRTFMAKESAIGPKGVLMVINEPRRSTT